MKINSIKIRETELGAGMPKICVPIVERRAQDILASARQAMKEKPDCLEFRADWYEEVTDSGKLLELLKNLREIVGQAILLFTYRSSGEGGEGGMTAEEYETLCKLVCESGYIDLLDVEAYRQEGLLTALCQVAHANEVFVVASNHDFSATPQEEELVHRLEFMDQSGADIPKLAVMPETERDILHLLSANLSYRENGGVKPIITMSMKGMGGITRISGEIFGSALTFATVGKASAPGQLKLQEARSILNILHTSCGQES
jgi:3-dehydroquinate dehydratase-1